MNNQIKDIIARGRWQPIEDFPKRGGEYLLKGEGFIWADFWREASNGDAYFEDNDLTPTHWMPLPDEQLADALEVAVELIEELLMELDNSIVHMGRLCHGVEEDKKRANDLIKKVRGMGYGGTK